MIRKFRRVTHRATVASEILITNALGILPPTHYRVREIVKSTRASHVILWSLSILLAFGGARIQNFTSVVRIAALPRRDYRNSLMLISLARCGESRISPCELGEWR